MELLSLLLDIMKLKEVKWLIQGFLISGEVHGEKVPASNPELFPQQHSMSFTHAEL